jgi:hypothetical protein
MAEICGVSENCLACLWRTISVTSACFLADADTFASVRRLRSVSLPGSPAVGPFPLPRTGRHYQGTAVDKKIWRHNGVDHLQELLAAEAPERPKLIVFEALYSMDGYIAPVNRICDVAERYDAMTDIDEVRT